MKLRKKRIAVLGSGLQGSCVAMALADQGAQVDLYERNEILFDEASAKNEGKIHLGYVYAHDRSLATARLMLRGALVFQPLLRRWLGAVADTLPISTPFHYFVNRTGLITPAEFEHHCRAISAFIADSRASGQTTYFGRDISRMPEPLGKGELARHYSANTAAAVYRTEEIAIDPEHLAGLFRARLLAEPAIHCLTGYDVTGVEENVGHLSALSREGITEHRESYDFVVNALWTSRLKVDAMMGMAPSRPWSFRLKFFVRGHLRTGEAPPSMTAVLGPYGDFVDYGGGEIMASWYPAGMTNFTTDLVPPILPVLLEGREGDKMRAAIIQGLSTLAPPVARLELEKSNVKGGWIFAWGNREITDPGSELHKRHEVGVHRKGRYLSIDTGKLTIAPLLAEEAASMIAEG